MIFDYANMLKGIRFAGFTLNHTGIIVHLITGKNMHGHRIIQACFIIRLRCNKYENRYAFFAGTRFPSPQVEDETTTEPQEQQLERMIVSRMLYGPVR